MAIFSGLHQPAEALLPVLDFRVIGQQQFTQGVLRVWQSLRRLLEPVPCFDPVWCEQGREHYEYSIGALTWIERNELVRQGQSALIKKDFPFPESLLSLLYLDVGSFEPLVKRIEKNTCEFLPSNDNRYVEEVLATLNDLASIHVYFELVRLEWRWRFAELKASGSENRVGLLPRKRITHIPSNIVEVQRQILDLLTMR